MSSLGVQEAEVRVEVIPESRYAKVVGVAADSVHRRRRGSRGHGLPARGAQDRPGDRDGPPPAGGPGSAGAYRLEVGSQRLLGETDLGGGDFGGDLGWLFTELEGGEETLEEVFARLNGPDENVLLKAQLTVGDPFSVDSPPAPVTIQQEVDLYLAGTASLEVEVVEP